VRHILRLFLQALLAVGVVTACGSGGTGPSGRAIDASDVTGVWTVTLTDTAGCAGSNFTHSTVSVSVSIDPVGIPHAVDGLHSTWSSGSLSGWLLGSFTSRVPGGAHLFFTEGPTSPLPPDSLRKIFEYSGTLSNELALSGTVTDPAVGWQVSALSPNHCVYRARGTHP
jgi:hypothetical protein